MIRVVVSAGGACRCFAPPETEVRLGSSRECDWHLPFPGVSRFHARAVMEGERLLLRDTGSKNGLFVGRERRGEVRLGLGESVSLGQARLALERLDPAEGELAISFEAGRPVTSDEELPTGTAELAAEALEPAARALLLARRTAAIHSPGPGLRRRILAEAGELLGVPTLFVGQLDRWDEVVLRDLHGVLPTSEMLAKLSLELRRGRGEADLEERWLLAPVHPGRRAFLAAGPLPAGGSEEIWKEMLLDFLAVRLLNPMEVVPEGTVEKAEPAAGGELSIPAGMVIGTSPAFQALLAELRSIVSSQMSILLLGESGTGKEVLARLVHASSPKADGPFVAVNCAALPAGLLEAELFGIVRRAATEVDAREGRFAQANGGTLFLDEVGDLPLKLQPKLLRALQEREILPVGGRHPVKVDLRIVAASNRDLPGLVASGAFSDGLFYRLAGVVVRVPPLAERREDLPLFIAEFTSRMAERHGKHLCGVTRAALARLLAWPWKGNVRELENEIEAAVLRAADGDALRAENLSEGVRKVLAVTGAEPAASAVLDEEVAVPQPGAGGALRDRRAAEERTAITEALSRTGGNVRAAAALLGLTPQGLRYKRKRLGLA